ncbi:spore germination protein [Paenibacillus koleovorans]|uniref:spore germination protein n=1 Tax=Paenibacillus koleovorans TaxID=121608 RepID=UPI000FD804F2|nr:spore germination protein [Paenibacillus koleovorans]
MFQHLLRLITAVVHKRKAPSDTKAVLNGPPTLDVVQQQFQDCADLCHRAFPELKVDLLFFNHLISKEDLTRDVIVPLTHVEPHELPQMFARTQYVQVDTCEAAVKKILEGQVALFHKGTAYLANIYNPETRSVQQSETETVIVGPHDAFVESAESNLSLIRRKLRSPQLKVIKLEVGEVAKTVVCLCYIEGLVNQENVTELVSRIQNIEVDCIIDGNMLVQHIDDSPNAIFPLFATTERVDTIVSRLVAGRIAGIVDGSPSAFAAPSAFFDFFTSPDDYYQRWPLATATRLLRFVAFVVTLTFTSLYVAVTTFHYEMIPESLLITLTESRSRVPFPPLYEALMMETTIELLREAGARLPTKIGQTIGIVGGIVIGQAAVQAGITSNILIIAVASSAIASFVIPSYVMSASIRLIRFGIIILAGILGNFGLMLGVAWVIIHLSGLTSLNTSYLTPVAPVRFNDWRDVFIRGPFWAFKNRPLISRSPNQVRNKMKK